jgi:hypothetical protein
VCPPEGGDDYYQAFATYQEALAYQVGEPGAGEPIVLVRQQEWVVEESPGYFVRKSGERLAEWRVEWLGDGKRRPGCIAESSTARLDSTCRASAMKLVSSKSTTVNGRSPIWVTCWPEVPKQDRNDKDPR